MVDGDPESKTHLVMRVQPETFGSNAVSQYEMIKFVSVNEATPGTLSGALCRLLFEGDNDFENPIKGTSCKIKKSSSRIHALVGCTSNMPDLESFRQQAKEMGGKATWTSMDFKRNMDERGGRFGCTMRMEEALPAILRRELFPCSNCSARFVKWCIRKYLLSKGKSCPIRLEDIWVHSDETDTDAEVNHDEFTNFWKVIKLDGDLLEKALAEANTKKKNEGLKSYRLAASEYEAFIEFQQYIKDQAEKSKSQQEICPEVDEPSVSDRTVSKPVSKSSSPSPNPFNSFEKKNPKRSITAQKD